MERGLEPLCRHRTRLYGCENNIIRYLGACLVALRTLGHIDQSTQSEAAFCPGSSVHPDSWGLEGQMSCFGSQVEAMQPEGRGGGPK